MASRVGSAVLALTAAALLAVSIVPFAWWSGHPTIPATCSDPADESCKPQVRKKQEVFVGPLVAEMCNTGGDGACKAWPRPAPFEIASYVVLGASGLLVTSLLLIAAFLMTRSDRRKTFAKLAIGLAVLGAGAAAAMFVLGPTSAKTNHATIPIGIGIYFSWGGAGLSLLASLLAMRPIPARKIVLKSAPAAAPVHPAAAPPVDLQAIMQADALRPASLGPEPMMGRGRDSQPPFAASPVSSPGGALPGPSGPLGAPQPAPLFASAPQLRPLYDANPLQGGTGGLVTKPTAPAAMAPPMIPRNQVSAIAGIPTPPPLTFEAPEPPRAPIPSGSAPGVFGAPPRRAKEISVPPPVAAPPRASSEVIEPPPPIAPPPPRRSSPSMPPPMPGAVGRATPMRSQPALEHSTGRAAPSRTQPPPSAPARPSPVPPSRPSPSKTVPPQTSSRPAPSKTQPPPGAARANPTIAAAAVPPPPAVTRPTAIGVPVPKAPLVPFPAKIPVRADTDPVEPTDTFDAQPTFKQPASPPGKAGGTGGRLLSDPGVPEDTDLSQFAAGDSTSPNAAAFESATGEQASFAPAPAPSPAPVAEKVTPAAAPVPARALPPITKPPPPSIVLPSLIPPIAAAPAPSAPETKVPISTAPQSLPPPNEKQSTTSGPSPACPQCEAPMAWVEAHLRFYCKSCKMYF